ncbi:ribosome biogenesis protein BOP1 [Tanacetum coccineum]
MVLQSEPERMVTMQELMLAQVTADDLNQEDQSAGSDDELSNGGDGVDSREVVDESDSSEDKCNQQHRIETELALCHKKIQAIMNGGASPYRFEENEAPGSRSFFTEIITSISDIKFERRGRYIAYENVLSDVQYKLWWALVIQIRFIQIQVDVNITTLIRIDDDGPDRSLLSGETTDRPGLLDNKNEGIIYVNNQERSYVGIRGLSLFLKFIYSIIWALSSAEQSTHRGRLQPWRVFGYVSIFATYAPTSSDDVCPEVCVFFGLWKTRHGELLVLFHFMIIKNPTGYMGEILDLSWRGTNLSTLVSLLQYSGNWSGILSQFSGFAAMTDSDSHEMRQKLKLVSWLVCATPRYWAKFQDSVSVRIKPMILFASWEIQLSVHHLSTFRVCPQYSHGNYLGDDDTFNLTTRRLRRPTFWLGSHTEGVITTMVGVRSCYCVRKAEPHLLLLYTPSFTDQKEDGKVCNTLLNFTAIVFMSKFHCDKEVCLF